MPTDDGGAHEPQPAHEIRLRKVPRLAHVRKTAAGTWQARYRGPDGRERARNFRRKVDAEALLATIQANKLRGEWTDPRRARISFGEWNTQVQQNRVNLAASTRDSDGSVIRSLILPTFGKATLSAIEPGHIRAWVADLVAAGYSPSTIRRAYTLLQLALEMAVDDGRLARSPCRRIVLPRIEQSEKRFLDIDEVEDLAETIAPRYRAFVLAGAYTGLRPGELAAPRTDRLDLSRRQLRVEKPIKTPAARRTVSFSPFLTDELAAHLDTYPGDKNLIFSAPEGGPLDLRVFRRRFWYPAVRGFGRRTDAAPRPPPHPRRPPIAAGEDPYVISQRLGHASIRTTYDIYGHLFEGRDRQAADAREAARA